MATGLSRPLARSLKGRMFSAAAQAESKFSTDDKEPKCYVKKLNNGLLVGTIETNSPVSRLAVVANAGSRFETGDNLGVAHCLRHAAKLRTENMSNLGITRATLQLGSDITCKSTREYLFYKSSVTRNCAPKIVEILRELTTKHVFKNWELNDLQSNPDGMALDLAMLKAQPQIRLVENLHAAAFRDTLGRSLYAPEYMIGKYNPEQLQHYVKSFFGAGRLALCGVGIDQNELEELGNLFEPYGSVASPTQKASYYGGEIRDDCGGELSYVAVACGGPRLTFHPKRANKKTDKNKTESTDLRQASKDLLPSEVLRHILGVGPHVKYSQGATASQLAKAVAQKTDAPFAISSLNANYSDAGIFGFTAIAPSSKIEGVVRAAANQFKTILSGGVSEKDVSRAKNQLKAELCYLFENPDNLLTWLAEQTLNSDQVLTPQEIYKMIDPITTSDVNNVAKKMFGTKPSMAVSGNASNVPYIDKLFS